MPPKRENPYFKEPHPDLFTREGELVSDLLKNGFSFHVSMPFDNSIKRGQAVTNVATKQIENYLDTHGLSGEQDGLVVIKNLHTLYLSNLQLAQETRVVPGKYSPEKGLIHSTEWVAVFRRFDLSRFMSRKSPDELESDGYKAEKHLPFYEWGDSLCAKDEATRQKSLQANDGLEKVIELYDAKGYLVRIAKPRTSAGKNMVDVYIKNKPTPDRR